jgi:hypothetical protein
MWAHYHLRSPSLLFQYLYTYYKYQQEMMQRVVYRNIGQIVTGTRDHAGVGDVCCCFTYIHTMVAQTRKIAYQKRKAESD